jgi:hypothetical protein
MKSDVILRLTRGQYRKFAEIAKCSGVALEICTYTEPEKAWGRYSLWAMPIFPDVREERQVAHERGVISLASAINTRTFRECGRTRPELDWSALADDEIYSFVLWHEIGHRVDNFSLVDLMCMQNVEARDECHGRITCVNEVLADRYAWNRVCPDKPRPLTKRGVERQEEFQDSLGILNKYLCRGCLKITPLQPGQYHDVPESMLRTSAKAAFVGPEVSQALVQQRIELQRKISAWR